MKLGICYSVSQEEFKQNGTKKMEDVLALGYDYIEYCLLLLPQFPEKDFSALLQQVRKKKIPILAGNCLFPAEFQLLNGNQKEIEDYLKLTITRAAQLGIQKIVFGSGGPRSIPDDMEDTEGEQRFLTLFQKAGKIARENGAEMIIEPLNHNETNIAYHISQAHDLIKKAQIGGVLADSYHMSVERDRIYPELVKDLKHVHFCNAERKCAKEITPELKQFAEDLKALPYNDTISFEGGIGSFPEDAVKNLEIMKELFCS